MIGGIVAGTVFNHMDQTRVDMQEWDEAEDNISEAKEDYNEDDDADNMAWKGKLSKKVDTSSSAKSTEELYN